MTKLIIQIPCYNEEAHLSISLKDTPRELLGCSSEEWLIIDDGSSDRTVQVAKEYGADQVVSHMCNLSLACAFMIGLETSESLGAQDHLL